MAEEKKALKKMERDIVTRQEPGAVDEISEPEMEEEERALTERESPHAEGMGIEEEERKGEEPNPEIEEELNREDKTDSEEED
jgi:hypothetical protein